MGQDQAGPLLEAVLYCVVSPQTMRVTHAITSRDRPSAHGLCIVLHGRI